MNYEFNPKVLIVYASLIGFTVAVSLKYDGLTGLMVGSALTLIISVLFLEVKEV